MGVILNNNLLNSRIILLWMLFSSFGLLAQTPAEQNKEKKEAKNYLREAQHSLKKGKFAEAEADYRKAIALNPKDEVAKYNLGTAYYDKQQNQEAMLRFKQAASTATTKEEKHKAFHNLGNTFMNEKKYEEAVAAYKDALRNNPNDDQTRYNLALAKDMLEKNPPPPDQNQDDQQDNKDQQEQQDQQENQDQQDNQDQDSGQDQESDQGDEKEDEDKGENKENKDKNQEDKGQPDQPKEEEGDRPEQQQVPGQLSPQQVKSLLEAMNNEEKKVQDKINAEKQKGVKVKSDKDW